MTDRTNCDNPAQGWVGGAWLLPAMLAAVVLLSGCEDDPGAPPPGAFDQMATAAASDPEELDDEPVGFTGLGDFEFSDSPLPAAERIYFAYGNDLWQISPDSAPSTVAEDLTVAGYSSSASGDRLAVLNLDRDDDGEELIDLTVFTPEGQVLFGLDGVDDDVDTTEMMLLESVAMNPDGDAMAVTHRNGAMTLLTLDGSARQLMQPSIDHRPGRLTWSSDGQFLAYLDPWMPNESSSLYVHVPARDIRQALVHPTSDGQGVVRARWIPGTPFIVMVKSSGSTISHGGDLFLVDAETGRQELLMSSGAIAPVAGIVDIAPSPDGQWLAATGFVPGDEYPGFAGLWMTNLRSGLQSEIAIESGQFVTDLWWLGDALLVRTIADPQTSLPGTYTGRESFRLLEVDPESGQVTERYVSGE